MTDAREIPKNVLRRHFADLARAISEPLDVASELFQGGIVSQPLLSRIRDVNAPKLDKNTLLLEAVIDQVADDTMRFDTFLTILRRDAPLLPIVESMETAMWGRPRALQPQVRVEPQVQLHGRQPYNENACSQPSNRNHASSATVTSESSTSVEIQVVKANRIKMQSKFGTLLRTTCNKLKEKTCIADFRVFLSGVSSPEENAENNCTQLLTNVLEPSNFPDIFAALSVNRFWNFWPNYHLLQEVIREFVPELHDMVVTYKQDLSGFLLTTKVAAYIASIDPTEDPPPCHNFETLTTKVVAAKISQHSLKYIDDLWMSLVENLPLPKWTLPLHKVERGCISITWLVPLCGVCQLARHLQSFGSAKFFESVDIVEVTLGNKKCYSHKLSPLTTVKSPQPYPLSQTITPVEGEDIQVPVHEFIEVLTDCIGKKWKSLARVLHFSQADIDSIERANHYDLREEIHDFFHRWQQCVGREASNIKVVEGLRAAKLEEELKHMEEAGLVPTGLERFSSSSDATPPQVSRTTSMASTGSRTISMASTGSRTTSMASTGSRTTSMASTGSATSYDRDPNSKMKELEAMQSPTQLETDKDRPFEVDDLVKWEQLAAGNTYYGVIRWIGPLLDKQIAGIEMEEKPPGGSSGELQGMHYFDCLKGHGIFLPLEMLERDDRFDSIKSTELAVQEMNISGSDAEKNQTRRPSADKTPDKGTPSSLASRHSQSLEPTPLEVSPCTSKNRAQQSHSLESTPVLAAAAAAALFSGTDSPLQKELQKMEERLSGSPQQTSVSEPNSSEENVMVLILRFPDDQADLIIGREGRNIREVEDKTNTRINIQKRDQHNLGTNVKAVIVGKEENCKKALCMILEDVRRKIARQIATSEIVLIPTSKLCGRVIGKDGSTRNAIERLSGARLKIDQKEGLEGLLDQTRTCRVTGSVEQIEIAKEFIQMAMDGEDIVRMATLAAVIANLKKEFREIGFEFE